MPTKLEAVTASALRLPRKSRERLAERLYESLDAEPLTEIDRLWVVEAQRRLAELRSGRVKPIPLSKALRSVRDVLRR